MKQKEERSGKSSVTSGQLLSERSSSKIAILHDAFLYRGGGERLVTLMAKSLDADLISGFFSHGSFDPRELGFEGEMRTLGRPVFMKGLRHMVLKWRFRSRARLLRDHDTVIFSGNCLDALVHVRPDAKKIYYCHTPPRYLFDFRDAYLAGIPSLFRPLFRYIFARHAEKYKKQLSQFDIIFTNSQNVHERLLQFCGYESEVLYPPTDTSRFTPVKSQKSKVKSPETLESTYKPLRGYYISFCRLSPPKRVDTIVEAFIDMPDQHLILTYGKNDPEKDKILDRIRGKSNILALESPDDTELIHLIHGATASIYIPIDEDFGMAPVESMACGTPVIGAREGGLLETVIDGQTGRLIEITDQGSGVTHLKQVIRDTSKDDWKNMQENCIERAKEFSLEKFEKRLQSFLTPNS